MAGWRWDEMGSMAGVACCADGSGGHGYCCRARENSGNVVVGG